MRLFAALALPDPVIDSLLALQGGVPGARWQTREQLHLTLRFIGEVDGLKMVAIDDALSTISAPAFTLELKAAHTFGGRVPRDLWVGAMPYEALSHLQRKIESALQRIGLDPDRRKFTPHVTLARLKKPERRRVMEFVAHHALYASGAFAVDGFILYSSKMTSDGSIYRAEKAYRLEKSA
jgi:2'-5' RNA ligase